MSSLTCPYSRRCGGCQLLAMSYEEELAHKQELARRHLSRFGKLLPILGAASPCYYRNKVEAAFGLDRSRKVIAGTYEPRSHRIVDINSCLNEDKTATAIIVTIKKLKPHFSMGQVTLMTDLVVIVLGGFVFGNIDAVLYGVISTYAASVIIDKIIYGAGSGKLAIIITTDGYATAKKIDEETGRGATLIKAIGTYSGIERHLILCACGKAEIFKVRNAAHAVDPNAFVMITEASEVFGEGFTPPELDQ